LKIVVKKFLQTCADNSIHPTAACLSFVKSIQGIEGVVLGVESLDHAQQLSSLWSEIEPGDVDLTLFSGLKETDPKITDPRFW
jgi:hypothetical protein